MRKIDKRLDARVKLARPLLARAATLTLPYHERCKSRLAVTLDSGEEVALLLPRGTVLAHDDVLVADDGDLVRVVAAAETVLQVRANSLTADPDAARSLIRAAYHLGNRHTPVEIAADYLQLEADPVLRQMLEGIGMQVKMAQAPFQPEAGAYGGGHRHGHDESFAEDYALAQQVYAEHEPGQAAGHAHDHGHGHSHAGGHDHDHDHAHAHGQDHDHSHGHTHQHDHDHDHTPHGHSHDCDACGHDHPAPDSPHAHR